MNVKREIRKQRIRTMWSNIMNAIFDASGEKMMEKEYSRTKKLREMRIAYNRKMSDEELIRRLLDCTLKDAIRKGQKIIKYHWCEGMLRCDTWQCRCFVIKESERQAKCFVLNQLERVNNDKYINTWLGDNDYMVSNYTLMGDIERRLHLEVVRQLEKMGVKASYKVDETLDRHWRSDSHYVKTLVIELPL